MEVIMPWLTPALLLALFTWLRVDIREQRRELNGRIDKIEKQISDRGDKTDKRIDDLATDVTKHFDEVNKRFDQVNRELADQRERMAKLEGSLEGFLAGRRDRDAAA